MTSPTTSAADAARLREIARTFPEDSPPEIDLRRIADQIEREPGVPADLLADAERHIQRHGVYSDERGYMAGLLKRFVDYSLSKPAPEKATCATAWHIGAPPFRAYWLHRLKGVHDFLGNYGPEDAWRGGMFFGPIPPHCVPDERRHPSPSPDCRGGEMGGEQEKGDA